MRTEFKGWDFVPSDVVKTVLDQENEMVSKMDLEDEVTGTPYTLKARVTNIYSNLVDPDGRQQIISNDSSEKEMEIVVYPKAKHIVRPPEKEIYRNEEKGIYMYIK